MEKGFLKRFIAQIISIILILIIMISALFTVRGEISFNGQEGLHIFFDGSESQIRRDIDESETGNERFKNVDTQSVNGVSPYGAAFQFKITNKPTELFEDLLSRLQAAAIMDDYQGIAYWVKLNFSNNVSDVPFAFDNFEARHRYDGISTRYLITKDKVLKTLKGTGNKIPKDFEGWVVIPRTSFSKYPYDPSLPSEKSFKSFTDLAFGQMVEGEYAGGTVYMDNMGAYTNFDEFCETRVETVEPAAADDSANMTTLYQAIDSAQTVDISSASLQNITSSIASGSTGDGFAYQFTVDATSTHPGDGAVMIGKRYNWNENPVSANGGIAFWYKNINKEESLPLMFETTRNTVPVPGYQSSRYKYDETKPISFINKNKELATYTSGKKIPAGFEGWIIIPKASLKWINNWNGHVPFDPLPLDYFYCMSINETYESLADYKGNPVQIDNVGTYDDFDLFCSTRTTTIVNTLKSFRDVYQAQSLTQQNDIATNDVKNITPSIVSSSTTDGAVYQVEVNATSASPDWAIMIGKRFLWNDNPVNAVGGVAFWYKNIDKEASLPFMFETTRNTVPVPGYQSSRYKYDETKPITFIDNTKKLSIFNNGSKVPSNFEGWVIIPKTSLKWVNNWNGHVPFDPLPFDYFYCLSINETYDSLADFKGKKLQIDDIGIYDDYNEFTSSLTTTSSTTVMNDGHISGDDNRFMTIGNGGILTSAVRNITGGTVEAVSNIPKDGKKYKFNFTSNSASFITDIIDKNVAFKINYANGLVFHIDTTNFNDDTKLNLKVIDRDKDEFSLKAGQTIYYFADNKASAVIKKTDNVLPVNFNGLVLVPTNGFELNKTNANGILNYIDGVSFDISSVKGLVGKDLGLDDIGVTDRSDNLYACFAKAPIPPSDYNPNKGDKDYMTIKNFGSNEDMIETSENTLVSVIENETTDGYGYRLQLGLSGAKASSATFSIGNSISNDLGIVLWLKGWKNIGGTIDIQVEATNGSIYKLNSKKEVFAINSNNDNLLIRNFGSYPLLANYKGYFIIPFDSLEKISGADSSTIIPKNITISIQDSSNIGSEPIYVDNIGYYSDFDNLVEKYSSEIIIRDTKHNPNKDAKGQTVNDNNYMNITNGGGDLSLVLRPRLYDSFDGINTIVSASSKSKDKVCYSVTPTTINATASFANAVFKMHSDNDYAKGKELLKNSQGFIMWIKAPETMNSAALAVEFHENILDNGGNIVGREVFQIDSAEEFYLIDDTNGKYKRQLGNFVLRKGFEGYVLFPYSKMKFKYEAYYGANKEQNKIKYPSNGILNSLDSAVLWWWPSYSSQENVPLYVDDFGSYTNFDDVIAKYAPNGINKFEVTNIQYLYDPNEPNANTYMKTPTNSDTNISPNASMAPSKFYDYNSNSIILRWNMLPDVNQYLVYVFENVALGAPYSTNGYKYIKTILVSGDACFVENLKPNTQYTFQVSGADDSGQLMGGLFYPAKSMKTLATIAKYYNKYYIKTFTETINNETIETTKVTATQVQGNNGTVIKKKAPILKRIVITENNDNNIWFFVLIIVAVIMVGGGILVFILLKRKKSIKQE